MGRGPPPLSLAVEIDTPQGRALPRTVALPTATSKATTTWGMGERYAEAMVAYKKIRERADSSSRSTTRRCSTATPLVTSRPDPPPHQQHLRRISKKGTDGRNRTRVLTNAGSSHPHRPVERADPFDLRPIQEAIDAGEWDRAAELANYFVDEAEVCFAIYRQWIPELPAHLRERGVTAEELAIIDKEIVEKLDLPDGSPFDRYRMWHEVKQAVEQLVGAIHRHEPDKAKALLDEAKETWRRATTATLTTVTASWTPSSGASARRRSARCGSGCFCRRSRAAL